MRGEADAAVAEPARRAHLAVPVLAPRGADNVTSLHGHDLPAAAGAASHAGVGRWRGGDDLAAGAASRTRVGRRRGSLRGELVVRDADSPEGEELRLEGVVVGVAGVAHGREKGILGGQAPLPHGRRGLKLLELEDGDRRRVCLVLLHFLVELEQPVVVLLFICFLLVLVLCSSSSAVAAAASVSALRNPVVVPRIQIPRLLLGRRYWCCSDSSNARPSTSTEPITRTARNTEKNSQKRVEKAAAAAWGERREERKRPEEVVARDGH